MAVQIPLFELGVVLFPHMPLPLHVFEERYRTMLRDCEAQGIGFGVVAIREGREVGGGAVAHDVGTLARIVRVDRLDDGRANLLVTGASRFRVLRRIDRAYPAGEIEYLADTAGEPEALQFLGDEVVDAVRRYSALMQSLGAPPEELSALPDDPELLGYLVAASLQVELSDRQRLLEADSIAERLRICLELLRREEAMLERRLARRGPSVSGISLN